MKPIYIITILVTIIAISLAYVIISRKVPIVTETYETVQVETASNNYIDIDKIFKRPSQCIFKDSTICSDKSCVGIDWENPLNATDECKKVVNGYCRSSKGDGGCQALRQWKKKQTKPQNRLEHPSLNCQSCTSKVDLSQFAMVK